MEKEAALRALAALASDRRIEVFRLLVREGPDGLPAGSIAAALDVPVSSLSFHLKELERAGLARSTRRQRQILYAADPATIRGLLAYLVADCCRGHPEICGGLDALLTSCAAHEVPPCPTTC